MNKKDYQNAAIELKQFNKDSEIHRIGFAQYITNRLDQIINDALADCIRIRSEQQ